MIEHIQQLRGEPHSDALVNAKATASLLENVVKSPVPKDIKRFSLI